MITLEKGDLFAGTYDAISHGVNCKGVMGAGISRPFMTLYPEMYEDYKAKCITGQRGPGAYDRYIVDNGLKAVYNLFSQNNPGPDATPEALFLSLLGASHDVMVNCAKVNGLLGQGAPKEKFRFAMPLIGCGIGGLEFKQLAEVVEVLDKIFGDDIEYVIVYNDQNENLLGLDPTAAQWYTGT